jgi:uncharacterized protein (DUF433 family)
MSLYQGTQIPVAVILVNLVAGASSEALRKTCPF